MSDKTTEIKVAEIVIQIGKKELRLSKEDAKALKLALEEVVGKTEHVYHHDYWYRPYWTWQSGIYGAGYTKPASNLKGTNAAQNQQNTGTSYNLLAGAALSAQACIVDKE